MRPPEHMEEAEWKPALVIMITKKTTAREVRVLTTFLHDITLNSSVLKGFIEFTFF